MPNEPTRRIEAELKAYADQRRAEASPPFELHPVNRRLLQDEVARALGRGETRSQPDRAWLKWLWPRLAVAGVIGVVGVFAVLQLTPSTTKAKYQMAKASAPLDAPTASMPAPAATPASEVGTERDRVAAFKSVTRGVSSVDAEVRVGAEAAPELVKLKDAAEPVAPTAPAVRALTEVSPAQLMQRRYGLRPAPTRETAEKRPAPDPGGATRLEETAAAREPLEKRVTADAAPTRIASAPEAKPAPTSALSARSRPALAAPTSSMARRSAARSKAESDALAFTDADKVQATQRFVQVESYRRNFNSPAPPPVLRSFQLRQRGLEVEIEDADGSVYRGTLGQAAARQAAFGESKGPEIQQQPTQQPAADFTIREQELERAEPTATMPWRFVAVGTNLSLNERVVFAGELVTGTNAPAVGGVSGGQVAPLRLAPTGPAATSAPQPTRSQLVPLLRIQGQAVVGEGTKLEISARPVNP